MPETERDGCFAVCVWQRENKATSFGLSESEFVVFVAFKPQAGVLV